MGASQSPEPASKLGALLIQRGLITPAQLDDALVAQGSSLMPLGSTLVRLGYVDEAGVAGALAEQLGMPAVCLSRSTLDTEVLSVIPAGVASGHRVLPLAFTGSAGLSLGMAKSGDQSLLDEIAFASGRSCLPFVAVRASLDEAIRGAYEARAQGSAVWKGSDSAPDTPHLEIVQPESSAPALSTEVSASALDAFPDAPPTEPRPAGSKPLVLAVDDEPDILEMLRLTLGSRGMDVVCAGRGREALDLLRAHNPDLVLLDAMLPEIHGFELCSHIKRSEHYRSIPVIIISAIYTGWNFSRDVRRMYGADDYIEKPFSPKEVAHRVEQMLAKQGSRPAAAADGDQARLQAVRAFKRGLERLQAGDIPAALQAGEIAVSKDPFEARGHFVLAMALQAAGRFYEAISAFERVVELAPEQFRALQSLAVLYERQGFKAKAVEMWMRALEYSPSDAVRQTIKAHLVDLL